MSIPDDREERVDTAVAQFERAPLKNREGRGREREGKKERKAVNKGNREIAEQHLDPRWEEATDS